jgi:hypothetical protein
MMMKAFTLRPLLRHHAIGRVLDPQASGFYGLYSMAPAGFDGAEEHGGVNTPTQVIIHGSAQLSR